MLRLCSLAALFTVLSGNAFAWTDAKDMIPYWGNEDQFNYCGSHNYPSDYLCLSGNCNTAIDNSQSYRLMIATDIKEHGARFCPIDVDTSRSDNKFNAWTKYSHIDQRKCLWMCRDGYAGEGCSSQTVSVCDTTNIDDVYNKNANNFNKSAISNGTDAESDLAGFYYSEKNRCGHNNSNVREEHDLVLVLVRTMEHGGYARMVYIKGRGNGGAFNGKFDKSWPQMYVAKTDEFLVCANGYKPDGSGKNCMPIDAAICDAQAICDNWPGFDPAQHTVSTDTAEGDTPTGCKEFRCTAPKHGFKSETDRTCIECGNTFKSGVNKAGVCTTCKTGEVFNETDGECKPADGYSKHDLMYGKDKPAQTVLTEGSLSCWLRTLKDDILNCIKGSSGSDAGGDGD